MAYQLRKVRGHGFFLLREIRDRLEGGKHRWQGNKQLRYIVMKFGEMSQGEDWSPEIVDARR